MELTIPGFSGFYESIWKAGCDSEAEYLRQEGLKYADYWHFSAEGMANFADQYANEYLDLVNNKFGLHLTKTGKAKIDSPREYNFRTDEIWFEVEDLSDTDLHRVIALMKEYRGELREIVKKNHSSCDGFISFMSNDVDEWIDNELFLSDGKVQYLSCVLHYLLRIFGEGDYDEMFYDLWGYESVVQCMEYEPELKEEYEKYLENR